MHIMTQPVVRKLDLGNKILLGFATVVAVAAPFLFGLASGTGQSAGPHSTDAATETFRYEVASIKPSKSESRMVSMMYSPDGFIAKGVTLRGLIRDAYGTEDSQITQTPPWFNSERYDVEAKMDKGMMDKIRTLGPDERKIERQRMLQLLLADRFALSVHVEIRQGPTYALVVAKKGPKLQESKPGETYSNGIKGLDGLPLGPNRMRMASGELTVQALPMETVAHLLSMHLGRTVVDKTGLMGNFDFTLQWIPEPGETPVFNGPDGSQLDVDSTPGQSSGPTLFVALEEQLGLKLKSQKGQVKILVIDHVQKKPTQN